MKKLKCRITAIVLVLFLAVLTSCSQPSDSMPNNMITARENSQAMPIDRSVSGLNEAEQSQIVELKDRQVFQMEAKPVFKDIDGNKIKMYAYNGQIPGPLIKAKQGSLIYVNFTNNIDMDTTIHWHGIRLENKYDGVPDVTQKPVKPGESFLYEIKLPDEGIYWYHPHIREDLQQELGLYGNIFVEPKDNNYFNKADSEIALFLDDIKIRGNDIEPFNSQFATFTMMGRFGSVMLVNGETDYKLNVNKNEVIRLYLTDSANARSFNFMIENHKLKLVGSDSGKYEKEFMSNSVIISPGERYIAEVNFDDVGVFRIIHRTPKKDYVLGEIIVNDAESAPKNSFSQVHENEETIKSVDPFKKFLSSDPDYTFSLEVDQDVMSGMQGMGGMSSVEEIEWEDSGHDAMMNSVSNSKNVEWIIKDSKTGKINMENNYKVKVGDVKKIRFVNSKNSMHPMQHPMHLHGQRFLVLSVDGAQNKNLAWQDTVLVPAGETVDILVEFSNPGQWMLHCHIAEHLEAGMMTQFNVVA